MGEQVLMAENTQSGLSWTNYAGAWLGIGTSPAALLVGSQIAIRYGGPLPVLSVLLALPLTALILWSTGSIGLKVPFGLGLKLTGIMPLYFDDLMQRVIGGVITLGMIGWFGFNSAFGAAALQVLVPWPHWVWVLILSLPILLLSLKGIRAWGELSILTTVAVIVLTLLLLRRLPHLPPPLAGAPTLAPAMRSPGYVFLDMAVLVGYGSVFSVRAPDFTAGVSKRRHLLMLIALFILPFYALVFSGITVQRGMASPDLMSALRDDPRLWVSSLLIGLAVIAPNFTVFYSGAPALRVFANIPEKTGMVLIAAVGIAIAFMRVDLWLGVWLSILGAFVTPLIVPMGIKSYLFKRGVSTEKIQLWTWLPASLLACVLAIFRVPTAILFGLLTAVALNSLNAYLIRRKSVVK
jgi:cytosine permease